MTNRWLTTSAAFAVVGAMLALGSPTQAVEEADPVVLTPATGTEVPLGFTGPITIDFSHAPADFYNITLRSADGGPHTEYQDGVHVDESTSAVTRQLTVPLSKPGTFEVDVSRTDETGRGTRG